MKTIVHNKLVRDNIPNIIKESGKTPIYGSMDEAAYLRALDEKLSEELAEYQADRSIEELADIWEVIRAIVRAKGMTLEEFEVIRKEKAEQRGGFSERLFLKEVIEE